MDEAARLFFKSVTHAPEHIKVRETEAHAYLLRGNYEKSYELATALRTEHPESWKAAMLRLYTAPPAMAFHELLAELGDDDLAHKEVLPALASRDRKRQPGQFLLTGSARCSHYWSGLRRRNLTSAAGARRNNW